MTVHEFSTRREKMVPHSRACPIPACWIEWSWAGFEALSGLLFLSLPLGPAMEAWLHGFPWQIRDAASHVIQPAWGIILLAAGVLQLGSLWFRWHWMPPYRAAMVSTLAMFLIAVFSYNAGIYIAAGMLGFGTIWQFAIAGMLKP